MGDYLDNLPSDNTPMSSEESRIMGEVFNGKPLSSNRGGIDNRTDNRGQSKSSPNLAQEAQASADVMTKAFFGLKDIVLASMLFAIFSIPQIDTLIAMIIPVTKDNVFSRMGIKVVLFAIVLFCLLNFNLARK